MIGWKMLTVGGCSLRVEGRIHYPEGKWINVPSYGAAVAITSGLTAGGYGPLLVAIECDPESECTEPPMKVYGVRWFRRVRRCTVAEADAERAARHDELAVALRDPDARVRARAVAHPAMTPELLAVALADEDFAVRCRAAEHSAMTPELLGVALGDPDARVRSRAFGHAAMKPELLGVALGDPDAWIRQRAAEQIEARRKKETK